MISNAVREAVLADDRSLRCLCRQTGVDFASLQKFIHGKQMRLSSLDRIAAEVNHRLGLPKSERPISDALEIGFNRRDVSLRQLSRDTGIHPNSIWRWSKRRQINSSTVDRLWKALCDGLYAL